MTNEEIRKFYEEQVDWNQAMVDFYNDMIKIDNDAVKRIRGTGKKYDLNVENGDAFKHWDKKRREDRYRRNCYQKKVDEYRKKADQWVQLEQGEI